MIDRLNQEEIKKKEQNLIKNYIEGTDYKYLLVKNIIYIIIYIQFKYKIKYIY